MQLNKDEISIVLDGLAALPLARSYNLFQKVLAEFRAMEGQPEVQMYSPLPEGSQQINGAAKDQMDA